uniref:Nitronate monooxygenase domain-containing protein n=1 Tax=Oryza glumipatula TaxID=40148 RepID=A0A0E0AWT9_9ORYZ
MGWKGILGFNHGVVQAPLGPDISGPELAAAVANAGGIGLLRLPDWPAPDRVRDLIRRTRSLTERPFGAAIVLAFPHEENLRVVLEEKLAVLQVYWGEFPRERVDEAHLAGVKVLHQVGSFEEAAKAKEAGVDGIIVQGCEAGGHVIGQEGLLPLLPRVVDLVSDTDISVIAAGGIVDGRGYAAALALGAQGVCLGTRFLTTEESFAHPLYKKRLIEINCTDYTNVFGRARWPGAPQRVLKTTFYDQWKNLPEQETEENQPIIGHTIIHGVHRDIRRFAGTVPNATTTGDIDSMVMYAGQGVGLITEIIPASEVVKRNGRLVKAPDPMTQVAINGWPGW